MIRENNWFFRWGYVHQQTFHVCFPHPVGMGWDVSLQIYLLDGIIHSEFLCDKSSPFFMKSDGILFIVMGWESDVMGWNGWDVVNGRRLSLVTSGMLVG
jgi:hypothetical protein